MSKAPYNPLLHDQTPRFIEGDEGGRFKEWGEWLKKSLMKVTLNETRPPKIEIRNTQDFRTWSWMVKGLAASFPVPTSFWTQILDIIPQTCAWDMKIQSNEPWLLTVLSDSGACESGIPSWIEASLSQRKAQNNNNPEIKYLTNTTPLISTNITHPVDEIGQLILNYWVKSLSGWNGHAKTIAQKESLANRWTPLVEFWSKEMVIPESRWMVQARQASQVRELLMSEEMKPLMLPLESQLRETLSRVVDYPVFEKLFWQSTQSPQWYATFEVSLATCGHFNSWLNLPRETSWFDCLNSQAQERSKQGPHLLPVGETLWTQLKKHIPVDQAPLWERVWLNARISGDVVATPRSKRL